jgi:hypothetical protein
VSFFFMWLQLIVLLFRIILIFFDENSKINLFWVHSFLLFQWMYSIISLIVKPRIVFGILLSMHSFLHLTIVLCNFMDLFKIFDRLMIK